ncbi:LLM class flavin-dependent oxidoreductase [Sporichthya polymorpha]|uniref:LLM class flavin-dependent oxidoreductase n=1 Tax=Sporichthya polymorpha TaxID=35751 RepID=UPI00036B86E1|nr:LLM class flavin-dependent oxidoreductase [Sporichthya polymorpha]
MKFHLIQPGMIGRQHEIKQGMAGQNKVLYQRYLEEIRGYVKLADELGYASYGHNEHHLQLEGFEVTNHPGMFSLFVGMHAQRMRVSTLGYVLTTHNPVRAAEEIATLDHMLGGRLNVGFTRGYQSRWVGSYASVRGANATTPQDAKARGEVDTMNREIFEECVGIVKKAWLNSTFSHKGKYWQFPPETGLTGHPAYEKYGAGMGEDGMVHEIGIAPRCYQDPHPPLYGAFAHSMRTIDMWAREGGKPIVMANQMEFCEALWTRYMNTAAAAGRDVKREDAAAWGGVLMLGSDKAKLEHKKAEHDWYWHEFFLPFGQGYANCLIGDADEVSRQIEDAHKRLGFNEMWLQFGQGHLDPEENEEELYEFMEKVAPRFSTKAPDGTWV